MIGSCGCPRAAYLQGFDIPACKESFGQIQKIIFSRLYDGSGDPVSHSAPAFTQKSQINSYFAAGDDTKLIISPYVQNPVTEAGAARTFGGGNQTLNGVEIVIGREGTSFSGVFYQEYQSVIASLKKLQCEELGVYLIDNYGNFAAIEEKPSAHAYPHIKPIPISNLFISDKGFGGLEEPDSNTIQWNFVPNYSDDLILIFRAGGSTGSTVALRALSPFDYNPLTDLKNL